VGAPRCVQARGWGSHGGGVLLDQGRLDTAEQFAASALRTYDEGHRRSRTLAELFLAEVHVRAGNPGD
jgi:hypothetical protein